VDVQDSSQAAVNKGLQLWGVSFHFFPCLRSK